MVEDGDAGCYFVRSFTDLQFATGNDLGIGKDCRWAVSCNEKSAKYDGSGKYLTVKKPPIFLAIQF